MGHFVTSVPTHRIYIQRDTHHAIYVDEAEIWDNRFLLLIGTAAMDSGLDRIDAFLSDYHLRTASWKTVCRLALRSQRRRTISHLQGANAASLGI